MIGNEYCSRQYHSHIERGLHTVVLNELAPSSFLWGALTPRAFLLLLGACEPKDTARKVIAPMVIGASPEMCSFGESPEVCRFGESPRAPRCVGLRAPRCAVLVRAPRAMCSFGESQRAMWQGSQKVRALCVVCERDSFGTSPKLCSFGTSPARDVQFWWEPQDVTGLSKCESPLCCESPHFTLG
jgi:hypothetical protein